jgi:hypothetical protein
MLRWSHDASAHKIMAAEVIVTLLGPMEDHQKVAKCGTGHRRSPCGPAGVFHVPLIGGNSKVVMAGVCDNVSIPQSIGVRPFSVVPNGEVAE